MAERKRNSSGLGSRRNEFTGDKPDDFIYVETGVHVICKTRLIGHHWDAKEVTTHGRYQRCWG